uniref:Uncharacterized protein n=1 Tax=Arundo donax TaxID=35708 RepID=A0A0A8Z517_ARUDO
MVKQYMTLPKLLCYATSSISNLTLSLYS